MPDRTNLPVHTREPTAIAHYVWVFWLSVVLAGMTLLAAGSRYTVTDCQRGGPPGVLDGCFVLDRWTGDVQFRAMRDIP